MRRRRAALVCALALVSGSCGDEPKCKEKKLSDGTVCLVCTTTDLDGTNKRVDTSCAKGGPG